MKYSFIVPVYNCEAYLEDCVRSLLAQSGDHDFEILLIDDGAKDGSGALADTLAQTHPQVRAFHKENGGASSARNYGVREARGDYILFVDGDDTLEPSVLEEAETYLRQDPAALVVYGMSFDYYRAGKLERQEHLSCAHKGMRSIQELLSHFRGYFDDNALSSACNKVFSREILRKHDLFFYEEMTLYEDLEFVLRYLMHIQAVAFVDLPLYRYRNDLEKSHSNDRARDLNNVRKNLVQVMQTSVALHQAQAESETSSELLGKAVDLYLQLLARNLFVVKYPRAELSALLPDYCAEPLFRSLLADGAPLSPPERTLLTTIDEGRFADIFKDFQKRRRISKFKRTVKKLLRRFIS